MKQTSTHGSKRSIPLLPGLAVLVLLAAAAVILLPKLFHPDSSRSPEGAALPSGSDLVIQTEAIGTEASYFDYDGDDLLRL